MHRQQSCLALPNAILGIPGNTGFMDLCLEHCNPQMSQTEQADHSTVSSAGWKGHTFPGFPLSLCPALAGRHHDNCKDVFSCRTIVQSRAIFALLPAEVPDLLGYFFPETVFNLILLCSLVFPSGRGAGRHSRKAPCRVTRDFSLQSALLSTCALPFCHLILFGPDP